MSVRPAAAYRRLAIATVVLVYLLIVMGGIVRVTGSGLGCADSWPSCNGSLLPAFNPNSIIEFLHRTISVLAGVAVFAVAGSTWLWERRFRRLTRAAALALFLYFLQAALGALVVKFNLPGGVVMIHLANALLLLAVLVFIAVEANRTGTSEVTVARPAVRATTIAAAATYVLAMSGAFVVENSAGAACNGWPLCGGGFSLPSGEFAIINVAHRVVAAVVVIGLGAVMGMVIRRHRADGAARATAMLVNVLLLLQVAAGALVVLLGLPPAVRAIHLALASALWASVFSVALLARRSAHQRAFVPLDSQRSELRARAGMAPS